MERYVNCGRLIDEILTQKHRIHGEFVNKSENPLRI